MLHNNDFKGKKVKHCFKIQIKLFKRIFYLKIGGLRLDRVLCKNYINIKDLIMQKNIFRNKSIKGKQHIDFDA